MRLWAWKTPSCARSGNGIRAWSARGSAPSGSPSLARNMLRLKVTRQGVIVVLQRQALSAEHPRDELRELRVRLQSEVRFLGRLEDLRFVVRYCAEAERS